MDPRQFFETIVKPNYEEAKCNLNDLRLIYNAIITMNTVAEYVALERLKYADVGRRKISEEAYEIRRSYRSPADTV